MDLLLSFLLFVCLGTFLCNPKVASGDQTAAYKETVGGTMNCSRFPMSSIASHIFILLMIIYCHLQLLLLSFIIWQLCLFTFLDVRGIWNRVIEFLFE